MSQLFALLVGINNYSEKSSPRVPNLRGCLNDVKGYQELLEKMFTDKERCHVETLENSEATYDDLIKYFGEDHLLKAGKGDVVLFAYSGHGSRELADEAFAQYFPEGKMETLVCYDSREPDKLDLADKELAVLIKRIADKGAHVCVILDCCHSGSGTRFLEDLTLTAREAPIKERKRSYDQFLDGYFAQAYPDKKILELPAADHILLAACNRTEKAYEAAFGEVERGLFSAILQQILEEEGTDLSYQSLYKLVHYRLFTYLGGKKQTPQKQAYGFFNAFSGFLGQSEGRNTSIPAKVYFRDGHWRVNRGVINGNLPNDDTLLSFELKSTGKPAGKAIITHKGLEESIVRFEDNRRRSVNDQFEAFAGDVANDKMLIPVLCKDSDLLLQVEGIWNSGRFISRFFECVHSISTPISAPYYLMIETDEVVIVRSADKYTFDSLSFTSLEIMLADAYKTLEHIAKWEHIRSIDNLAVSNPYKKQIDFSLVLLDENGQEQRRFTGYDIPLYLPLLNGKIEKRRFRLEVTNKSKEDWYVGLGYLSEEYQATNSLLSFNDLIPAGSGPIVVAKSIFRLDPGEHEYTNFFKLVISKEKPNLSLLFDLDSINKTRGGTRSPRAKHVGEGDEEHEEQPELETWFTKNLSVKLLAQPLEVGKNPVVFNNGKIQIHGHSAFRSGLCLNTIDSGGRSIENPNSVLLDFVAQSGGELLELGQKQSYLGAPNVLLLNDMVAEESLAQQPLVIDINAGEMTDGTPIQVLPLAFDGEHIVPVGEVSLTAEGLNRVTISSLPENPSSRSLWRAAGFCFLKLALDEAPFLLRRVDYEGRKIRFTDDGLSTYVNEANDILLVVHGIIGNTKSMAKAVRDLQTYGTFDLVLAFDYENLNTKIEDIAGQLAEKLEEAGITADSGKKITILAHSMGGLVSRYFIEHLSGKAVVKKLVMAGTPNGGSELAKATTWRDRSILLLTLALNMPWNIPALAGIIAFLAGSKKFTVTLEQMNSKDGGKFLSNLNRGEDPGVPYYTLAGNVEAFFAQNPDAAKLSTKIIKKATDLFYHDEPNDLAVSIASVNSLPTTRNLHPQMEAVVCHHLNYFSEESALEAVQKALLE